MNYRKIEEVFVNGKCLRDILDNEKDIDLSYTDLSNVDLNGVNLNGTDLRYADLSGVSLKYANLIHANLGGANLIHANLSGANLGGANLSNANLLSANLSEVNLEYANLSCANLIDASLKNVIFNHLTSFYNLQCPEEGSFIGYKVADGKIVKLLITEDAKRSSGTSRKCRCSKAKVLSITDINGGNYKEATSYYDDKFIYRVGEIVEVDNFDENRWKTCATGIHFFITREEAINCLNK